MEEQWVLWKHTEGFPDVNMGVQARTSGNCSKLLYLRTAQQWGKSFPAEGRACGKARREERLNSTVLQACGEDEAPEGPWADPGTECRGLDSVLRAVSLC